MRNLVRQKKCFKFQFSQLHVKRVSLFSRDVGFSQDKFFDKKQIQKSGVSLLYVFFLKCVSRVIKIPLSCAISER